MRDLRRRMGISGRELSRRSGIPQSHISKFESGKLSPSKDHIKKISSALHLPREEQLRINSWSRLLSHDFSPFLLRTESQLIENQRLINEIEAQTEILRAFQCYVVPGLLQSPGYIKAIFETTMVGSGLGATTVANAIKQREKRQDILTDHTKQFQFVLHEMALINRLGSPKVMREQLKHLINVNRSNLVTLAMIPATSYWEGDLPTTSFDIFDQDLVLIESWGGLLYLWMDEIVVRYCQIFEQMLLRGITGLRLEQELTRILNSI